MTTQRMPRAIATALLLVGAGNAQAQFDYSLALGVEHNDNIQLSADDEDAETILRPSLGFSLERSGSALQANINGIVEYRNYLSDAYADQTRGHLLGRVNWIMIPNRLSWTFADALNVQPINQLQADAPANRQQTNVFATGPTLFFNLGPAARGQAELRYTDSRAEETERFNSQRIGAALRGIKELSASSAISLNLQAQQVEFDNVTVLPPISVTPDYKRYDAYLGYTRTLNDFDFNLAAGYSKLQYDNAIKDDGGPLLRANLGWRPSARSTLSLDLAYQYTDAADSMLNATDMLGAPGSDIITGDATVSAQPFRERRAEFGYAYQSERWDFSATPYYRELEYVNSPELDREGTGIRASVSWALRPRLNLSLYAAGENMDYQNMDYRTEQRRYGSRLGYQMTQRWSWHLSVEHVERETSPLGTTAEQNVAYLWLAFNR